MHAIKQAVKPAAIGCLALMLIVISHLSVLAASVFEGVWKVADTGGQPFEITLSADGGAKATRGEGMVGTWKEDGSTAVITWNTGWTTKLVKEGDHYRKIAYRKGEPLDGPPTNSMDAQKLK